MELIKFLKISEIPKTTILPSAMLGDLFSFQQSVIWPWSIIPTHVGTVSVCSHDLFDGL